MIQYLQKKTSGSSNSSVVVPQKRTATETVESFQSKRRIGTLRYPHKPIDRTLRCRYEIKYVVSEAKAMALMQFIEAYLPLDRYSKLRKDGAYPIVNLYMDSHNLRLCRESLEGHKNRFKLRIRSYTNDLDAPCFLEAFPHTSRILLLFDREISFYS